MQVQLLGAARLRVGEGVDKAEYVAELVQDGAAQFHGVQRGLEREADLRPGPAGVPRISADVRPISLPIQRDAEEVRGCGLGRAVAREVPQAEVEVEIGVECPLPRYRRHEPALLG